MLIIPFLMKWLLLILIMLPLAEAAPCVEPDNGMVFVKDAVLCTGEYYLPSGIFLNDGVELDCDYTTLYGDNWEGRGITIRGDDVEVRNCNIMYYDVGLYGEGRGIVLDTVFFERNNNAIKLYGSNNVVRSCGAYVHGDGGFLVAGHYNRLINNNLVYAENILLDIIGTHNLVFNNSVRDGGVGLGMEGGDGFVLLNKFYNNVLQATDEGGDNRWSFNGRGNCWDDYNGEGPYDVIGGSWDWHPKKC